MILTRVAEVIRLSPASFYPHARGSVLVPLPLLALPESIDAAGERWARKKEMHVTAVSTQALARRIGDQEAAWSAIAAALEGRQAGPVELRDELRVVRDGDERTIIAMAEVAGLAELHGAIAAKLGIEPQPPPAHVTLYTRPGGAGIGLHTPEQLERLSRPLHERPFPWPWHPPAGAAAVPDPLRRTGPSA